MIFLKLGKEAVFPGRSTCKKTDQTHRWSHFRTAATQLTNSQHNYPHGSENVDNGWSEQAGMRWVLNPFRGICRILGQALAKIR